jgi:hypothetical protein
MDENENQITAGADVLVYVNLSIWDTTGYDFQKITPEGVLMTMYSLGVQSYRRAFGTPEKPSARSVEALIAAANETICTP